MAAPITAPVIETSHSFEQDLERLLLIRHFEQTLLELFRQGRLNGTTHTCLGQEYIPVALMPLLRSEDYVFSNHRGHGHYLARFDDPDGLLAEIMGRRGAVCHGVGGSQHLHRERFFSTGVQGESLPVACGVALQLKREGRSAVALTFIGDGTWGQGAVYEALNLASLFGLPLLVVVENNQIAQTTPKSANMAGNIRDRVLAFGIAHHAITIFEPGTIRETLAPILQSVRRNQPTVVEFVTRRLGPHSKGDDTRSPEQMTALHQQDWQPHYSAAFPELFARLEEKVKQRLSALVADMEQRPPSVWEGGAA